MRVVPVVLLMTLWTGCSTTRSSARASHPASSPQATQPTADAPAASNTAPPKDALGPLEDPDAQRADALFAARLVQNPKDIRALMARAMVRQRSGDPAGAMVLYRRCIATDPEFGPAYSNLGALLLEADKADQALPILLEGAARAPEHAPLFANLAGALARQQHFEEAVGAAETAIELDPKDADLRRNLAAVHFRAGNPAQAERVLKGALAEFPEEAPDFLNRLAELYVAQEDPLRAAEMLGRINAMAPQLPMPWLRRAAILGRHEDLDGCISVLLEALEHHPEDEEIRGFFMAAMATRLQRDLESGMDRLTANPADVDAYLQVARVHEVKHDYQAAVVVLQDGVANNPASSPLWGQLGIMHNHLNQEADALSSYRRAISLDAGSAVALNNCAYLLATAENASLRNPDEALRFATSAVALEPANTAFLDTLAEVNLRRGDLRAAQELIDRALRMNPRDPYLQAQAERVAFTARTGQTLPPPNAKAVRRGRR